MTSEKKKCGALLSEQPSCFPDGPKAELHQKLKCKKIKDKSLFLYYKGFFINWIILNLHCSFYVTDNTKTWVKLKFCLL